MAENKLQIAIIGLGMIGTSAGLALHRYQGKVSIVGHDPDPARAGKAKQMGAIDRAEWNLINAVRKADRVLLAIPASEMRPTLDAIKEDLKPGCVLLDTADVKEPVLKCAEELLPDSVHFIGGHPILLVESLDTADARADLFDKKLFCLIPSERASEQALNLAIDLAQAMGAQPFFLDVVEHDGMAAVVDHLPIMLAGALMSLANNSSGWKDMRKLAGSQFYASTWVAEGDPKGAAGACVANKDHLVRLIDILVDELEQWKESISSGDVDALGEKFEAGMNATNAWVRAHEQGNWEELPPVTDLPTTGSYMRQMIGFGGMGRQARKANKK